MARQDNTITPGRSRNNLAAVISAILLLTFLSPSGALAGYQITYQDKTVETSCYWIEKSKVHLCEGGEPLALSEVSTILPGPFSPLETEMHRDTLRRFWTYVSWLLDKEAGLMAQDQASGDALNEMDALKALPEKMKELKVLKEKGAKELRVLSDGVSRLVRTWSALRIPERELVRLPEIKTLQMITWSQSLDERWMYLKTGDPTYREYTYEHMRHSLGFQESFMRVLRTVKVE